MDAVLNWIWQGGIVVLATTAMLALIRRSRGQDRYVTVWVALLSVLVLPVVPFIWAAAAARVSGGQSPGVGPVVSMPVGWWTSGLVVVGLWALWSTVYASRMATAVLALRRAKTRWREIPEGFEKQLRHWNDARTRGRRTRMVVSEGVTSAAVLGFGSPVIAVAPALIEHLSPEELDRVVMHEWAHVQRHDDYGHLVELCIRVVAGWHPAVWWLSRQLRLEREVACDEMAVAMTGRAKAYAACLAKLASLPATSRRALPGVAALSSSGLQRRIVRILSQEHSASPWASRLASAAVGVSLCALAFGVGGLRFIEAAAVAEIEAAASIIEFAAPGHSQDAHAPIDARPSGPSIDQAQARPRPPTRRIHQISPSDVQATPPGPPVLSSADLTFASVQPSLPVQEFNESSLTASSPSQAVLLLPTASSSSSALPISRSVPPWRAAADGGVAIGRGSQKAAEATAGFFSRFGKNIAEAF